MSIVKLLVHYLLPHESNNHKPKLLHSSSLFLITLILLAYQFVLLAIPKSGIKILGYASNISVDEVIRLTNEKRAQAGLSPLEANSSLSQAARSKGNDMLARSYWAHVAPDGTQPWKFFTDVGYAYRYAGENLARDFSNPSSAMEAWMASPSHRENILSPKYRDIGIAVVEGSLNGVDTTIIVQLFGTKISEVPQVSPLAQKTANEVAISPNPTSLPKVAVVSSPNMSPSPIPQKSLYLTGLTQGEKQEVPTPVLVSPFISTRSVSLIVVCGLMLIFMVDALLVYRRRIARIGGRSFAHISFLGMILAIILILRSGQIL